MALGDATPAEFRRDVELAREAGLDLLRVHGHISRPELYDAADELGMLLWQDFPLQWGYARTIRKEAVRQAREAVDQLGHHPSIAVWCAHNEPVAAERRSVDADRQGDTEVRRRPAAAVVEQDGARSLGQASVRTGRRDAARRSPTAACCPTCRMLDGTDSHLYFGWYHGDERDLAGFAASMPRMVRFVSEFGAQAVPAPPTSWSRSAGRTSTGSCCQHRHGLQLHAFEKYVPPRRTRPFDAWRRRRSGIRQRCCATTSRRCGA